MPYFGYMSFHVDFINLVNIGILPFFSSFFSYKLYVKSALFVLKVRIYITFKVRKLIQLLILLKWFCVIVLWRSYTNFYLAFTTKKCSLIAHKDNSILVSAMKNILVGWTYI